MRELLPLALLSAGSAFAAPTLYSQPYPAGPVQPTAARVVVNGTTTVNCTLPVDATGAVTPTCDLSSLPAGTYTLVLTVSNLYACTVATDAASAVCYGGGTASSDPFGYTWTPGAVAKPARRFRP